MGYILHISDLHLCDAKKDETIGDHKGGLVSEHDRIKRIDNLKRAFGILASKINEPLDSLIITGDITHQSSEVGFNRFQEILDSIQGILPRNDRIMLIPGNHDVKRGGATDRYERFLALTEASNYKRPYLEDVDDFNYSAPEEVERRILFDAKNKWAILAINSSHYCGVYEEANDNIKEILSKVDNVLSPEEQATFRESLFLKDAARITKQQLNAIERLAEYARTKIHANGILFLALHHHLLPPTDREEVKHYESIINLGKLRELIAEYDINVVLHGHKHAGNMFIDHIPISGTNELRSHKALMISSAYADTENGPFAQLISVSDVESSGTLRVHNIRKLRAKQTKEDILSDYVDFHSWNEPSDDVYSLSKPTQVFGDTFDQVYARVRSLEDVVASDGSIPNLICQIKSTSEPLGMPAQYPNMPDGAFDRLVGWWQKTDFKRLPKQEIKNHGLRLGQSIEEHVQSMAGKLGKANTSKATATLLKMDSPYSDPRIADFDPSFCLVQYVERTFKENKYLDIIGYFRKQELRFWWPVNVSELSYMQKRVLERLNEGRSRGWTLPGTISTISAIAHFQDNPPGALVQAMDMRFELKAGETIELIHNLRYPEQAKKEHAYAGWKSIIDDLIPPEEFDKNLYIPAKGLSFLLNSLKLYAANHDDLNNIYATLESIKTRWESFSVVDRHGYKRWRDHIVNFTYGLKQSVRNILGIT